jgi:gas vesicle structural protein
MSDPFDKIMQGTDSDGFEESDLSLLETLDHVLNKGLVIAGEITISVADIDLIFVGLNVLVSSVEKAHEVLRERKTNARSAARATLAASTPQGRQESE